MRQVPVPPTTIESIHVSRSVFRRPWSIETAFPFGSTADLRQCIHVACRNRTCHTGWLDDCDATIDETLGYQLWASRHETAPGEYFAF
jgi:hypothetical protein